MRNNRNERYEIYTKVFELLLTMDIKDTAAPLEDICEIYGIRLTPLSEIIQGTGLTESEIYEMWGNKDGCINLLYSGNRIKAAISYNDTDIFNNRYRFTVAEEIMHYVLGHYKYKMYYPNFKKQWNEKLYQKHDEAARIGAGLLLCPPPMIYEVPEPINESVLENFCDVSTACAKTRVETSLKFANEIKGHHLYSKLVEKYNMYISKILCPACGFGFMFKEHAILCRDCYRDYMMVYNDFIFQTAGGCQ